MARRHGGPEFLGVKWLFVPTLSAGAREQLRVRRPAHGLFLSEREVGDRQVPGTFELADEAMHNPWAGFSYTRYTS